MYPMNNIMQNQYSNPYQSAFQNQFGGYGAASSQQLTRVNGLEGAKAYQMGANSTVALFDANEDLMYIKTTDGAGFPTIRTFQFEELAPTQMSVAKNNDYVSREEMEEYVQQFIQKQSKTKQAVATDEVCE